MSSGQPVDFAAIAKVMGESANANVYLVGRRGKILACQFCRRFYVQHHGGYFRLQRVFSGEL